MDIVFGSCCHGMRRDNRLSWGLMSDQWGWGGGQNSGRLCRLYGGRAAGDRCNGAADRVSQKVEL